MDYAWAALAMIRLADGIGWPGGRRLPIPEFGLWTLAVLLLYALGWIGLS